MCLEVSISEAESLIPTLFLEFNTSCLRHNLSPPSGDGLTRSISWPQWTLTNFNPELDLLSGSLGPAVEFDHFEPIEPPAWFDGIDVIDGELT